jgi:hypothetical protein
MNDSGNHGPAAVTVTLLSWTGGDAGATPLERVVSRETAGETAVSVSLGEEPVGQATVRVIEVLWLLVSAADRGNNHWERCYAAQSATTATFAAVINPDVSASDLPDGIVTWSGGQVADRLTRTMSRAATGSFPIGVACGTSGESATLYVYAVTGLTVTGAEAGTAADTYYTPVCNPQAYEYVEVEAQVTPALDPQDFPWGALPWTGGGYNLAPLTRGVPKWTTGQTAVGLTCGTFSKTVTINVEDIAVVTVDGSAVLNGGTVYVQKAASGDVVIAATLTPAAASGELPAGFATWAGGAAVQGTQLQRTVTKTATGATTVTCQAGTTGTLWSVTVVAYEVVVNAIGFVNDHLTTRWPSGNPIDSPDGSSTVWPTGGSCCCYTKDTVPTIFAVLTVSPSFNETVGGLTVRTKVGTTIIGTRSGVRILNGKLEDADNTDGDIDGITGGTAVPGSNVVTKLSPTFVFEISTDGGTTWCGAGSAGPIAMYVTDGTPAAAPLYDLGLDKACGYVNGNADIGGRINTGLDGDIRYDPAGPHYENLSIYGGGRGECCCHSSVFSILIAHVTSTTPTPTYVWGGCSSTVRCHFYRGWQRPTFRCTAPAHDDSQEVDPHFTYHVVVSYGGVVYDPSYGSTGMPTLTETAPMVLGQHAAAATRQTAAGLPAQVHDVNWLCPH